MSPQISEILKTANYVEYGFCSKIVNFKSVAILLKANPLNIITRLVIMTTIHDSDLDVRVKKGTERISENMHIIANEPSLAFYRLQEHVRKVTPGMLQKRAEVTNLHQDLQGCCYDVEYALSAIKSTINASKNFTSSQAQLKNAVFLRQQLKYEECKRNKKDPQSTFKRLSAHITLDLPDIPDALRETANRMESIMTHARQTGNL